MGAYITLWGRNGDSDSLEAISLLKQHGFAADRLFDMDRRPPTGDDWIKLSSGFGGTLQPLLKSPMDLDGEELAAFLEANPSAMKTPVLLTPKGALAGLRERKWLKFLEVDKIHDP
ncbi:MAG: arsenate reductase family protein [Thermoplasmatota archaeon]